MDAHSTSSLDVSWRLPIYYNGPLDGYRVSWCEAGNCAFNFAFLKGADRRSYRITGLNAYTKYRVKVNAYNMDRGEYLFSSYEDMNVFTLATGKYVAGYYVSKEERANSILFLFSDSATP